ncbi:unnamed protein product [Clonostachys rosea]|uniref:Uncharacterized protein n=1 Tax=Bionectria ochroleuca TaxID=29856 RepID=A0ABY6UZ72_BIOOC|nr:unnamed protein product [Clonostachys rosea]
MDGRKEPGADQTPRANTHRNITLDFGPSDANNNKRVWVAGCDGPKVTVEAAFGDGTATFSLSRQRNTGSTLIFSIQPDFSPLETLTSRFNAFLNGEIVLEEAGKVAITNEWLLVISRLWEKYEMYANDPAIFIQVSVRKGRLLSEVRHQPGYWKEFVCGFPTLADVAGKKPKRPISVIDYDDVIVYQQHDQRPIKLVYLYPRSEVGDLYLFHGYHFMDFLGEVGGFPSAREWKKTLKIQAAGPATFVLAKAPELRGPRVVCAYLEPWGECLNAYRKRVALGGKVWTDCLD